MIDPAHGRRIPSGRRLAVAVRDVLRAMHGRVRQGAARGTVPDLSSFRAVLVRAILPVLLHEYHLGRLQARKVVTDGRRAKAAALDRRADCGATGAVRGEVCRGPVRATGYPARRSHVRKASFPFGGLPGPPSRGLIGIDLDLLRDSVPDAVQRMALDLAGITAVLEQEVRDALETGLRAGEANSVIADSLSHIFAPSRAYTIAQTESSRAMHAGEEEYAKDSGADGLEWLASSDACERCLKLNGSRVKFGEPFATLTSGNPTYRVVMHPPLHPRCMCTAIPWWS